MRIVSVLLLAVTLAACDASEGVVEANSLVTLAYEGQLTDGTVFDQNDRVEFNMANMLPGFREGVLGMMTGESRTFSVPPEQAYGDREIINPVTGEVLIPPNSTLIFEVTVFEIR
ncbi:MAG: FKBP-type peptidyl-prolyl cis-trans isomerase [Bacteroidota bacterium]